MDTSDFYKSPTISQNFKVIEIIGSGTYGDVILAQRNDGMNNKAVAIKVIKSNSQKKSKLSSIQNERLVLEKCKENPFIVQIQDFFKDRFGSFFVLDYVSGGELYDIIQERGHLSEDASRFYASQVLLALEHLHSNDIVYRDLKPENILLDQNGYIQLTDFGLSEVDVVSPNLLKVCGTPEYVAPEMLFESGYGKQVDHWSLGVLIYEMITGHTPFEAKSQEEIFEKIKFSQVNYPACISPQLKSLFEGLFMKHPCKRLGFKGIDQIKKHPWFMKTNWEGLKKKLIKAPFKNLVNKQKGREQKDNSLSSSSSSSSTTSSAFEAFQFKNVSTQSPTISLGGSF